ncbi:MAG: ABC transporter substrate-binding protein [Tunicatimonas sp.]
MIPFTVGGVPEYFNMPWHQALEDGSFAARGLEVTWKDYPGGTGAMMHDLREGVIDVAVALTEGVVAEIINRQSCRIAQWFVTSPLRWGVHVAAAASYQQIADLQDRTFAVSRLGSGSHLMAYVLAQHHGWSPDRLRFELVNNLDGARQALAQGVADGFLWEQFTTQPWVDAGEFRRVGVIDTPWPCFVVAVRASYSGEGLSLLLDTVNQSAARLKAQPGAAAQVAQRYALPISEPEPWWERVRWATDQRVEKTVLHQVMKTLAELSVVPTVVSPEDLCGEGCELV